MWQDIAALTPPLVMCAAFLIGVVFFLRHQMGSKREAKRARSPRGRTTRSLDIPGTAVYAEPGQLAQLPVRPVIFFRWPR